jgi:hypothetical protein
MSTSGTPAAGSRGASTAREPRRVGSVRPSQLIHTFGIGSLVELPHFSVLVAGIDRWDARYQATIVEPRLIETLRGVVGPQLAELKHAPHEIETRSYYDDWAWIGVPAYPFPRWFRCTKCKRLDHIDKGVFEIKVNPVRTDQSRYFHDCGGKNHNAQPVRVVAACPAGHLDDFPWEELVHADRPCTGSPVLELRDTPGGSRATDQKAVCLTCTQEFTVRNAFKSIATALMPQCRGREPHLDRFDPGGCKRQLEAQLVGASNAWFATSMSALSLPVGATPLEQAVNDLWNTLEVVASEAWLDSIMKTADGAPLRRWTVAEVWAAMEKRRNSTEEEEADDLRLPEWRVLTNPSPPTTNEFEAAPVGPPKKYKPGIADVVAVNRLREVSAMYGFTRIASLDDADETGAALALRARISTNPPTWLPASETRGEGIFFAFPEAAVAAWEAQYQAAGRYSAIREGHRAWRLNRDLDPDVGMPCVRYLLLHTFSHLLINEISVECGYNTASVRERLYVSPPGDPKTPPMAGLLIYSAAPDSEGTLGGLVSLAEPAELERLFDQCLDRARLCTADPHCADHRPGDHSDSLHGAACYACLFLPETSCEKGNRYLDRAAVVPTLTHAGLAYSWT